MFEYKLEKELQEYLVENFNKYFDFKYVGTEYKIPGGIVDLIGISKDRETIYLIELKRDYITNKAIKQVEKYIKNLYESGTKKKAIGIVVAPEIDKKVSANKIPENIRIMKLNDVKCTNNRTPLMFNVSFNNTNEERFMLLVLHGLVEDAKHLPRKSQLLKIALEDFLKNQNIKIPDNFKEEYGHYFEDIVNDNKEIKEVKKEEIKLSEPIKEEINKIIVIDDDDMGINATVLEPTYDNKEVE